MDAATMKAWDDLRGRCLDALAECPWAEGTEGYNLFAGYLDNAAERDSLEHYRNDNVRALVDAAMAHAEADCEVPAAGLWWLNLRRALDDFDAAGTTDAHRLAELERQLLEAYNDLMNTCASLGETVYSYDDPDVTNARGAAVVALRAVVAVHDEERRRDNDPDAGRPAGAAWPANDNEGCDR